MELFAYIWNTLLSPVWKRNDLSGMREALLFINSCENQKLLARIAKEAPEENVRLAAVEKITDQRILLSIVLGIGVVINPSVRLAALKSITDPEKQVALGLQDSCWELRAVAAEVLTDPGKLADLALYDESASVRAIAAGKVKDQAVLEQIVKTDADIRVRRETLNNLEDPELRVDMMLEGSTGQIREAIQTLPCDDPRLLTVVERYHNKRQIDRDGLFRGNPDDVSSLDVDAAVSRMSDTAMIVKAACLISQDLFCYETFSMALQKLSRREDLLAVLNGSADFADAVVERLRDVGLLDEVMLRELAASAPMYAQRAALLELDKRVFRNKLQGDPRWSALLAAYDAADLSYFTACMPGEMEVEACLLLLREYGEEKPLRYHTPLAWEIVGLLKRWYADSPDLGPCLLKAKSYPIGEHRDFQNEKSCNHTDCGIIFHRLYE